MTTTNTTAGITWSNSALTMLQQCGEKFRRRYIEREYTPTSPRALRGTVVHRSASAAYKRLLASRPLPSDEETRDLAATEFEAAWRGQQIVISDDELEEYGSQDSVRAHAKDFAIDLSSYHVRTVAPLIRPVGVERRIVVKPRGSDIAIVGTIDLIDGGAPEGGEAIRDLKTSEKRPNSNAAETSQQLTLYALIRMAEVGAPPSRLTLDYLVRTPKIAQKSHVPLTSTRTHEDVAAMVRRINTAVDAVKRGVFVPANPDSWYCARAYCDYFDSCPYVRRGAARPSS